VGGYTLGVDPAIASRLSFERLSPGSRSIYDRLGGWYRWLSLPEAGLVGRAVRLLDPRPDERVLEIGPGSGRALAEMAGRVGPRGMVVGIERSPAMLRLCGLTLRRKGAGRPATLLLGDGRKIPIAAGCLHAALLTFTLELFPEAEMADVLLECMRVVRPGGRLAVLSLSRHTKPGPIGELYLRLQARFPKAFDCRFVAAEEAMEQAGWHVVASLPVSVWSLPAEIVLAKKPTVVRGRRSGL
jgi:demethylmenaquinone methyltransferase/2-methoxy-6-polyprenyl-1,4-benzoquinol methylase